MECPRDALGRNECFEYFSDVALQAAEDLGNTSTFLSPMGERRRR